ncbi:molybdenum cofactor biosynthesis protein A [Clostridium baratii]|uniref:Molybdenum cofactor biosynthesis protein A n=2 Tax=Clostridium baratii TaxID=1561 RepID=A0A0A7FWZ1_9CLOT|nr:molybdenum cofactor biosynthesis protein A [Clostridium baratii str. Sullivan]CUP29797.1 molybdenum cofactor biosynthesis protein A [Clostridium baratii]
MEENILSNEEIYKIAKEAAKLGIRKVRLTGGEPLVRKGIVELIKKINSIDGIEEICLTTNGILLEENIDELYKSGLRKVNISLDTLNKEKYNKITRGGDINKVINAIDKCLDYGIVVKLNVVIIKGINDDEILDLMNLTLDKKVDVRFIELMPIGEGKKFEGLSNEYIKDYIKRLNIDFDYEIRESKDGPAKYIKLKNSLGRVGFISPMSNCFCEDCNRIRITTEGTLKQCLNWKSGINLKKAVNSNSEEELKKIIEKSIYNKPEKYLFKEESKDKEEKFMNEIGG